MEPLSSRTRWLGSAFAVGTLAFVIWRLSFAPAELPSSASPPVSAPSHPIAAEKQDLSQASKKDEEANDIGQMVRLKMLEWEAETNPYIQNNLMAELEAMVNDADTAEIVRALPPQLLETPFGLKVLERWGELDRKTALEWMANRDNPTEAQVAATVRGWMNQDQDNMLQYLAGLSPGPWKEKLLSTLGNEAIATQQPQEAILLIRQMQPGERQETLLGSAAFKWAESDTKAATEWINQIPDPELQMKMVGMVAGGYANFDPQGAAQWLIQSVPPGTTLDDGIRVVIGTWVQEDSTKKAEQWVEQLPEGSTKENALRYLNEIKPQQ